MPTIQITRKSKAGIHLSMRCKNGRVIDWIIDVDGNLVADSMKERKPNADRKRSARNESARGTRKVLPEKQFREIERIVGRRFLTWTGAKERYAKKIAAGLWDEIR